jgi:hypothetical protein
MEENVRQELDAMVMMVSNWKGVYLSDATPEGNNDFLVEEFQEEMTTYMGPYLRRLFQCDHITAEEAEEFRNYCHSEVEDLRSLIREVEREAEPPPAKLGLWQKVVQQTASAWRKGP